MVDETALLKAARNLDPEALVTIFDEYSQPIYRYVFRLCNDASRADDVVGEVFARLLDQLKNGKGPRENLRSYLYQMAYHGLVDHGRKEKRFVDISESLQENPEHSISAEHEQNAMHAVLLKAIHELLTEDQKDVIVLRFIEGFSVQETADIIGKDTNNVKVIQNRAIGKLRQIFNQDAEAFS